MHNRSSLLLVSAAIGEVSTFLDPLSIKMLIAFKSDIRAELDHLPRPSELMFVEPNIVKPDGLPGCPEKTDIELYESPPLSGLSIHISYTFQIELRLVLNRVHAALYSFKKGTFNRSSSLLLS